MTPRSRPWRQLASTDPRSLGLVRIALGVVLLHDLAARWPLAPLWYVQRGLLPPDVDLAGAHPPLSFLFALTAPWQIDLAFGVCAAVYGALLVGYRARLAQLLALCCVVSLHARVDMLATAGDFGLTALTWWTLLLPLGRRFSVDAVLAHLAWRRESTPEALTETAALPRDDAPTVSFAVGVVLLQLAALQGVEASRTTRPAVAAGLAIASVLTIVPWGRRWGGRGALLATAVSQLALLPEHSDVGLLLVVAVASLLLVSKDDWDRLVRRSRERSERIVVHFDDDCGICFAAARLLVRLDLLGRIDVVPTSARRDLPEGFDPARLAETMLVVEQRSHRYFVRARALARIVQALPMGWTVAWVVRLPGVETVAGRLYDGLARRRAEVSAYLGWAACGTGGHGGDTVITEPSVLRQLLAERLVVVRELGAVALLLLTATSTLARASVSGPFAEATRLMRLQPPLTIPQVPSAPGPVLVASGTTARGAVVDALADVRDARRFDVYASRVGDHPEYHAALRRWVFSHAGATRRGPDAVVAFDVSVADAPGSTASGRRLFGARR